MGVWIFGRLKKQQHFERINFWERSPMGYKVAFLLLVVLATNARADFYEQARESARVFSENEKRIADEEKAKLDRFLAEKVEPHIKSGDKCFNMVPEKSIAAYLRALVEIEREKLRRMK